MLTLNTVGNEEPDKLINEVSIAYRITDSIQIFAGCVLADALRRIYNSLRSFSKVVKNRNMLCLHIVILVMHFTIFTFAVYLVFNDFRV